MQVGEIRPATVDDFKQLLDIVFIHDGWEAKPDKGGVKVWTKSNSSSPVKMIKLAVDFDDISAVTLYDVLHDPNYRVMWDESMIEGLDIYKLDDFNDIGYYSLRCPPPMKNRDFVNQRSWGVFGDDHMIMNHTIDIEEMPVKKDFIRGVSYLTGYVIRRREIGCSVHYITQNDPGGTVPKWLLNRISSVIAPKVLEKIHKATLSYESWKSKNDPEWRPWRGIGKDTKALWPKYKAAKISSSTLSLDGKLKSPAEEMPALPNGTSDQYGSLDSLAPVPNSETARRLSSSLNADTVTPGAPDEIIGNVFSVGVVKETNNKSHPPLLRHESITIRQGTEEDNTILPAGYSSLHDSDPQHSAISRTSEETNNHQNGTKDHQSNVSENVNLNSVEQMTPQNQGQIRNHVTPKNHDQIGNLPAIETTVHCAENSDMTLHQVQVCQDPSAVSQANVRQNHLANASQHVNGPSINQHQSGLPQNRSNLSQHQSNNMPQNQSNLPQAQPNFSQNQPNFSQNSPNLYQNQPNMSQNQPNLLPNQLNNSFVHNNSNMHQNYPSAIQYQPNMSQNHHLMNQYQPNIPQNNPLINQYQPSLPPNLPLMSQNQHYLPQNQSAMNQYQPNFIQNHSSMNQYQPNQSSSNQYSPNMAQNNSSMNQYQPNLPQNHISMNQNHSNMSQNHPLMNQYNPALPNQLTGSPGHSAPTGNPPNKNQHNQNYPTITHSKPNAPQDDHQRNTHTNVNEYKSITLQNQQNAAVSINKTATTAGATTNKTEEQSAVRRNMMPRTDSVDTTDIAGPTTTTINRTEELGAVRRNMMPRTDSVDTTDIAEPTTTTINRTEELGAVRRNMMPRTDSVETAGSQISDLCYSISQLTKGEEQRTPTPEFLDTRIPEGSTISLLSRASIPPDSFASVTVSTHPIDPDCCSRVSRHVLGVYGVNRQMTPSRNSNVSNKPTKHHHHQVDTIPEKSEYRTRKKSKEPEGLESSSFKFINKLSSDKSRNHLHRRKKKHHVSKPHDHVTKPHDHVSKPHDHVSKPHDDVSKPHDDVSKPHDHVSKPNDHVSKPNDHVSKPHDHVSKPHDYVSKPYDHVSKTDDHMSKPHDHVSKPHDHVTKLHEQANQRDDGTDKIEKGDEVSLERGEGSGSKKQSKHAAKHSRQTANPKQSSDSRKSTQIRQSAQMRSSVEMRPSVDKRNAMDTTHSNDRKHADRANRDKYAAE